MDLTRLALWSLLALMSSAGISAQQTAGDLPARAFEPYETIRATLAADKLDGIPDHAARLAPLAAELGGSDARQASERLGQATDLKSARDAFGVLSKALVPKFREAKLAGVFAFECSMVKLPWAQRGENVQNPYMGKAMSTCGIPIKDKEGWSPFLPLTGGGSGGSTPAVRYSD